MKQLFFLILFTANMFLCIAQNRKADLLPEKKDTLKTTSDKLIVGTLGIGGSSLGFPLLNAGLSFQKKQNIFALRYIYAKEIPFESLASLYSHSEPFQKISEIGIYYGRQKQLTRILICSLGAGISYVEGIKRGKYVYTVQGFFGDIDYHEEVQFKSPGLIMDSKIALRLGKYVNLGLNGFVDLNLYKSFWGTGLSLNFNVPLKR